MEIYLHNHLLTTFEVSAYTKDQAAVAAAKDMNIKVKKAYGRSNQREEE